MSYPDTAIDKITVELHELAKAYADKAADLASDPYFKEAVMKSSVSGFVWALYHAFKDDFSRDALNHEMKVQSAAIDRAVGGNGGAAH
ncbi:MAG TPA: hypothetical protein VGH02_05900 [Rhizomicrobium sp.]|jgi:hypothetical protein